MRWLYAEQAKGSEVVAVVESAGCPLDAIQVITGCTLGKGNLIIHDHGRLTFTFVVRQSGRGIRVSLKAGSSPEKLDPGLHDLQEKVNRGTATPEESADLQHRIERVCRTILESSSEQTFNVREVTIQLPLSEPMPETVICARCGKSVSHSLARRAGDKYICQPCNRSY